MGVFIGAITALLEVPALVRVARTLRTPITPIADLVDGDAATQGLISSENTFASFARDDPVVWRKLEVYEAVGRH